MCSIKVVLCSITSNTYSLHMIIQRWNINPSSFLHFMRWGHFSCFHRLCRYIQLYFSTCLIPAEPVFHCISGHLQLAMVWFVAYYLMSSRSLRLDKILILAQHTHHLTILNFSECIWHLMVLQLLQCPSFRLFEVDLINVLLGGVVTSL